MITIQNPDTRGASNSDEVTVDYHRYQFLKAYLHNVFGRKIEPPQFHVIRLLAIESGDEFTLKRLTTNNPTGSEHAMVIDRQVLATVFYMDQPYEVMVSRFKEVYGNRFINTVGVLGLNHDANRPTSLLRFLVKEATQNSPYKWQVLSIKAPEEKGQVHVDVEVKDLDDTKLSDMYLSCSTTESLQLFIECVKRYADVRQPLRYLLSGKPGTGKTKIIKAVANEVKGYATFILANGSDERIDPIFDLAECFSPVVVCIDDVDLLVGNRARDSHREPLAKFLQRLDGFISSGVFVLATTNDKKMVDMAASRPGRFDSVLDIGSIDSSRYMELITTKTSSNSVLTLFTEEVLVLLDARKVSGAFIASLVKHLEIVDRLAVKQLDEEYVLQAIDKMKNGFCEEPSAEGSKVGFGSL